MNCRNEGESNVYCQLYDVCKENVSLHFINTALHQYRVYHTKWIQYLMKQAEVLLEDNQLRIYSE